MNQRQRVSIREVAAALHVSEAWVRASARALVIMPVEIDGEDHLALHELPALEGHVRQRQGLFECGNELLVVR
jgi:hypothetical protein